MNLSNELRQQLSSLGACGDVSLDSSPRRLQCTITQLDALAVSFTDLRLSTSELASVSVADLQRLSESLSNRLTYLLEPIAPIESDADQCVVQMRSNPPQKDDDGRSYYELLVRRGGELQFLRYTKSTGQPRQPVPATLTKEVLARLVGDFESALDEFVPT